MPETPTDPFDRLGEASTCLTIRLRRIGPDHGRLCDVLIDVFVGSRLRHLREAHRMEVSDVNALAGIPGHSIARYESGKERVPAPDLIKLAPLFGVGLAQFFSEHPSQITGQLN
jgi:hypothetical protein